MAIVKIMVLCLFSATLALKAFLFFDKAREKILVVGDLIVKHCD